MAIQGLPRKISPPAATTALREVPFYKPPLPKDQYVQAGTAAAPASPVLEKNNFIEKSRPASVDASWINRYDRSFSDAASVDSFLNAASGIPDNLRIGGKTIGALLFESPQRKLSHGDLQPVVNYLRRKNQTGKFLTGTEGAEAFLALNQRGHQELDYWRRLAFVLQKLDEAGFKENGAAQGLIQGRINELQEILYQSYLNVAGALNPAGRDQLDQTLSNPPPAETTGTKTKDEEVPPEMSAGGGAKARVRIGSTVTAKRETGGKVDMEAGKKMEALPRTFAPRILGVRGTVGPAFGTLLRLVPPSLGKQISPGAKETHNAAREVSLRNGGENNGNGLQGSLALELHPLARSLGYPFSIPFGWGAFAAGYAGHYVNEEIQTDQHVAFLELQLGLGLSLGELAATNDYFDLNFHVGLFRLGYAFDSHIKGYYPFGPTQIGLCTSVFKWSLCVDHQRWNETDSVEGGKETNRLGLTTLLLGSYF